ncbi:MAG: ABC transporter ATP-binding protein [Reyranellaceae bacterium]
MLTLEHVDVFYGNAPALHDLSIALEPGQIVALVGRNGAGKSTTLKTLCGLLPCRRGVRMMDGVDVTRFGPEDLNRAGVAFVPEDRQIFPTLTADENLRMAQVVRRNGDWTIARVFELFPRLAERRNALGQSLSGGEQQMLSIGRALLCCPKYLLLDEPTEGLAPLVVAMMVDAIREISKSGVGLALVEQNFKVPSALASRFVVLESGRIAWEGNKEEFDRKQSEVESLITA